MNERDLRVSREHWRRIEKQQSALLRRVQVRYAKVHALRVRRDHQLAKLGAPGLHDALQWGLRQVGTTEHPPGSNRGPMIDLWNSRSGVGPGPSAYWCQSFANAVLKHGGGVQLVSGYTVQVVDWANAGQHGLKRVKLGDAKPGDFFYFKWPGVSPDFCDHVGVYLGNGRTLEGNTSPGSGGSQNNGGGVFIRERGTSNVVAVVRPNYGAH